MKVTTQDNLLGEYSYEGKEIIPPKFEEIRSIGNYIIAVFKGELSIYKTDGTLLSTIT